METGDENVFRLTNRRWWIEHEAACKKMFSSCNIICFAKISSDSLVVLLFITNFRLYISM